MGDVKQGILDGKTFLGIELGSTRIKAVLINEENTPIASGGYEWENQYVDGIWTYPLEEVWKGIKECYGDLSRDVEHNYGVVLKKIGGIGISAMMHGYLAFDEQGNLLVPFRTWRNTMTEEAAKILTDTFQYNIPQRWSIAHLQQAVLNKEAHVKDLRFLTTLSGYVHWKLTGEKVIGIGDASGMFPIDINKKEFDGSMLSKFDTLNEEEHLPWKGKEILPKVLCAGEHAGILTKEGAKLLDPKGNLTSGIPLCPPEGDAGTGMTATNSVEKRRGNVSAGTSIFAMLVLEKELTKIYPEIDLVTTPDGSLVAMDHCNNCTSDLNAWVNLFKEFWESMGMEANMDELFSVLYQKALEGDQDCGKMLSYNYFSGETMTGFEEGRPLFVRMPGSNFNIANFMRTHLFSSLGALKVGWDILLKEEKVTVNKMLGHGGFFKTKGVGQKIMAAALHAPISVMETAGEGGSWGIALLASYMIQKEEKETLGDYLNNHVFKNQQEVTLDPEKEDVESFEVFMNQYKKGLPIERAAVDYFNI